MCTNTFTTYTNSRYLSKNHVVRWKTTFKCGYCAECIRQKRSEWRLRTYYEAKRCFSDGGFVLFDTLTYSDEYVRYFHDIYHDAIYTYWDFYAFSRDDVKKFFKRLRSNLERAGFHCKDKLRYILTCEYGTSQFGTHRPHYHIIFFVNFPIDPLEFSMFVSRSWSFGITDGIKPYDDCAKCPVKSYCHGRCLYKSKFYVQNERLLRDSSANLIKLTNYVTKYITKDMYTYKKYYSRVYKSFSVLHKGWQNDYNMRLQFRRFKNNILPFHLQSKGYGLFAIVCEDTEKMLNDNGLSIPANSKQLFCRYTLPDYYKRKLLYYTVYINGVLTWCPNQRHLSYTINNYLRSKRMLSSKIRSVMQCSKDKSDKAASYILVRSNMIVPSCISSTDDRLLLVNTARNVSISESPEDAFFYNHNSVKDRYKLFPRTGSYISDKRNSDNFHVMRISHCWSHKEFEHDLNKRGYRSLYDKDLASFCEAFLGQLRLIGRCKDYVMAVDDMLTDRYKSLGMLK